MAALALFSHGRRIGERDIRRHPGAEPAFTVIEADLDAEDLLDALSHRLHVARGELGGAGNLLDHAREILSRLRIHAHGDLLAELYRPSQGSGT